MSQQLSVVVTGAGGFIGHHLTRHLVDKGYSVRGVDVKPPALVATATGYRGEVVWDTSKPNGQPRRRLATDRARALLGFEAAVPLREGIAELVAWYHRSP